jgi:hypothetical protein
LSTFIRSLECNVEALEGDAGNVRSLHNYDIDILKQSKGLIEKILHQVRKEPKAPKEKDLRTNLCRTKHPHPFI